MVSLRFKAALPGLPSKNSTAKSPAYNFHIFVQQQ